MHGCVEVESLKDLENKVQHAHQIGQEKLNGHKTCPNVEEWKAFLDNHIYSVVQVAEQDIKEAVRRTSSVKARLKAAEKVEEPKAEPAPPGDGDQPCDEDGDDDDDDSE